MSEDGGLGDDVEAVQVRGSDRRRGGGSFKETELYKVMH